MKRIKFNGLETEFSDELLEKKMFEIDFNGKMMVLFSNTHGKIIPINSMNGGGYNCFQEIRDKEVVIEDI